MLWEQPLEGQYLRLRSVQVSDASFVLKLRRDEQLSRYIHEVEDDVSKQVAWITAQQQREMDYYFIAEDKVSGEPLGLGSVYNFNGNIAEYGRWISIGNQLQSLEMVLLLFDFAFTHTNAEVLLCVNVKENSKVVSFWKRFGAHFSSEYLMDGFTISEYRTEKETYLNILRPKHQKLLARFMDE